MAQQFHEQCSDWQAAPDILSFEDDATLHLWRCDLDQSPSDLALLNDGERERADRFIRWQDRKRFIVGRCFMRRVLGRYVRQHPAQVELMTGPKGKPALVEPGTLHFNLSHCQGVGYLAVATNGPIGVDVELDRDVEDVASLAEAVFSTDEINAVAGYAGHRANAAFLRCWTRKEAVVKAVGVGITIDLKAITVGTEPIDIAVPNLSGIDFVVRTVRCSPGEHVAVACTRVPKIVRLYVLC